jgi:UDP-2-acetamido-3-amino-2,3-dideoxy-glucuronate N-acetyltransferase
VVKRFSFKEIDTMTAEATFRPAVAVIGSGYWGKNLVRVFHELGALAAVCDTRPEICDSIKKAYPDVRVTPSVEEIVGANDIEAVVIAVPAVQHYEVAKLALNRGKDVFVEKPLALRGGDAKELVELARSQSRILMVGHILEYHPAVKELKRLVREGKLGKIQYIYSSRLNMGKLRTEENILWSFAPHDIAVILSLLNEFPSRVAAQGGCFINSRIADTTLTTCEFSSGVMAHIFVSWLHPFKEQRLCVVGDRSMAVFDDVEPEKKLVLYPHQIEWHDRIPVAKKNGGEVVSVGKEEPLREECKHFLDCIRERKAPLTDGESGLRVLQVLEGFEQSLGQKGQPIETREHVSAFYAHPTAVVDQPCEIGKGTKIWHFSHIMSGCKIGERCNLGQNVLVSAGVRLGNNVKVQNNVSIYTGVELEDDVFCGPSMVFTNVINPRSHIVRKNEYRRTLVKRGATLGANCTVICGVTIGTYAFIGAGAVVSRDVPDYALVMGVPGRQVAWMCYCGVRLPAGNLVTCDACGRTYVIDESSCQPRNNQPVLVTRAAAVARAD